MRFAPCAKRWEPSARPAARLSVPMKSCGGTRSQRTSGRFVTEDEAVIRAQRRDLAREQIRTFLAGMAQLGFDRGEIASLLEEEGESI